ncbi:m-AAA protease-interacting protein 1, mitochondrial [Periophthalmus magnuspinnatus]|uniref:m-AAA protease-interacting protein 1, mitochondrial n=1 Tax=Periophthalmus magnuspinnatus TaxID=409849 RepID=UPI00145B602A|nr:m-AAA protease-interacting protein 1, mitochondrial [Periophthalmus magnuspinnatus]
MHRARSLRSLVSLHLPATRSGAHCVRQRSCRPGPGAALSGDGAGRHRLSRKPGSGLPFAGLSCSRALCSGPERDLSSVSVVGSPDPLTWVRCRLIILLIKLYFEVDLASEEFNSGAKQALVQVSHLMSTGQFHRLKGLVSDEMMEYVETRTKPLSHAQKLKLSVNTDDIIFLLPEDVTVVFDQYGRKFCSIVMRFWFLTTLEGPEDPEATRVFRVAPSQDGSQQTKVATAVYEFRRELTAGASPDWTVITVWHWHWILAPKAPD